MAFVDDPNSNTQGSPIAGSSPLSNSDQQQDSGSLAPLQGSQDGSQTSQIQSGNQQPSTNKKAPKATSGMFTNIQKYVDKNRPQAQNMASAVTGDVGKQAEQIRQSVESQKAQQSKALTENQSTLQQNTDWAKNQIGNIMGTNQPIPAAVTPAIQEVAEPTPAPVAPYAPSSDDMTKFQSLMSGNVQGLQSVGDLNIADQAAKAQALKNLAQSTDTEQGRRNLLGQTFQKQGAYSRGMSGLDQLITSGDKTARENIIKGTQGQAQELQGNVQGAIKAYNDQKAAQDFQARNIGDTVTGFGTSAETDFMGQLGTEADAQKAAFLKELAGMQSQASSQFGAGQKFAGADDFYQALDDMYTGGWKSKGDQRDKLAEYSIAKARGQDVGSFGDWSTRAGSVDTGMQNRINEAMQQEAIKKLGITGQSYSIGEEGSGIMYSPEQQKAIQDYVTKNKDALTSNAYATTGLANLDNTMVLDRQGQAQLDQLMKDVISQSKDYGLDNSSYIKQLQNLGQASTMGKDYGWSGTQSGDLGTYKYDTAKFNETLGKIFGDINSAKENALQKQLENKYGTDYKAAMGDLGGDFSKFASGDFIDASGVATQDQYNKMQTLQNMMGKNNNQLGTSASSVGQDQKMLDMIRQMYGAAK